MPKTVVIMKTHIWSDHLEKFAVKIYNETKKSGVDFYILMHDETGEIREKIIDPNIKDSTLNPTESDIKDIYLSGFYSMWLSNHWLLMWFYKIFSTYDYYWSIEYDVRISGDSGKIWLHDSTKDFLYITGNHRSATNKYSNHYVSPIESDTLTNDDKFYGFLQLSRYSVKFLEYLDKRFIKGENGQDELIIFSLANRGGFTMSNTFLKPLVRGMWTWEQRHALKNKIEYEKMDKNNSDNKYLCIYHPIR